MSGWFAGSMATEYGYDPDFWFYGGGGGIHDRDSPTSLENLGWKRNNDLLFCPVVVYLCKPDVLHYLVGKERE